MPISIDRFESEPDETLDISVGSQPDRILRFLAERPDQAFRQKEIHEETGINRGSVGAVLSRLEDRGLVRHREPYWAVGKDERLASFVAQRLSKQSIARQYSDDAYSEEEWEDDLPDLGESV